MKDVEFCREPSISLESDVDYLCDMVATGQIEIKLVNGVVLIVGSPVDDRCLKIFKENWQWIRDAILEEDTPQPYVH